MNENTAVQPLVDQPVTPVVPEIIPVAMIGGTPLMDLPHDLYIPPEAMEVFLEAFAGPLDLLLYLIKKSNLDILDIPIAEITRQYMTYVELMKNVHLELAAEYLVMAATLAEIKSRMLLPRISSEMEEDDPRAELVRRLQEYERFKNAAEELETLPRLERDIFIAHSTPPDFKMERPQPQVDLRDLVMAFHEIMLRVDMRASHLITREPLSVRERMTHVLSRLQNSNFLEFTMLFTPEEGRQGVVVTFIAILELIRESLIQIVQAEPFAPIHIKAVSA
ncbi:MAG: segregation/condensation protein A [Gammaproteobacteria bacterium]|nr:segregation/condensation protein A [Gammaproteobacteria bacterium]